MTKRMGRPPGQTYGDLIHIRIPEDLRLRVDAARQALPDRPTLAVFVRQALVEAVKKVEKEGRGQ